MPDIVLDGEKVTFEGSPPGTLGELRTLLEQALQSSGRLLASFEADQAGCPDTWEDRRIDEFATIVGVSISADEAVRRLARVALQDLAHVSGNADEFANQVLRRAWSEVQGEGIAMVEAVAQLTTSVAALAGQGSGLQALETLTGGLSATVEKLIDLIQAGDAAKLALCVEAELLPMLSRVRNCLSALVED